MIKLNLPLYLITHHEDVWGERKYSSNILDLTTGWR